MLRDWLADCSFSTGMYFSSYFALSRSQSFGLLCQVLALLLSCLLLAMLFCLLLAMLFSVLFIISPLLDVERCSASATSLQSSSRCPRTRVAPLPTFHHWLVGCGSVSDSHRLLLGCGSVCISLTTGFLAVALSLILSRDALWSVTSSWMPRLHLQHHYSALCPSWLAICARAPWSCSLQQRVLLTMRTDLSFWSSGRFVAAAVRRWFPTPLRHHCVILWAVSTLLSKASIAASCHGVVRRFVRHRSRAIDPRVSLSSGFFL